MGFIKIDILMTEERPISGLSFLFIEIKIVMRKLYELSPVRLEKGTSEYYNYVCTSNSYAV